MGNEIMRTAMGTLEALTDAKGTEQRIARVVFPYGVPDYLNRVFLPGAFAEHLASGQGAQHLWTHNDHSLPLGPVVAIAETADGLHFDAKFANTAMGRDVWELVKTRALTAYSISWIPEIVERVNKWKGVKGDFRLMVKAKLLDVSPVNFPGMPGAEIKETLACPDAACSNSQSTPQLVLAQQILRAQRLRRVRRTA